jgi:hypothetical protein
MLPAVAVRQFLPRYARIIDPGALMRPRNSPRHRPRTNRYGRHKFHEKPHAAEPSRSQTTHLYSWGNLFLEERNGPRITAQATVRDDSRGNTRS